jgi:phosphatidylserine decarboxylase
MAKRHVSSALSSLFGRFAGRRLRPGLQRAVNRGYVRLMGLEMGEFRAPESYPTLNALFTRALEKPRQIDADPAAVISPCDAKISDFGTIEEGRAHQIKGMAYSVEELLTDEYAGEAAGLEGGSYANFYLSPRDYHRYHIPFDLEVESVTHVPGKLYPVNMPLLKNKLNLFIENERVILAARDRRGRRHFLILVGALNVGRMVVTFEPRVHTNGEPGAPRCYRYEEPIGLEKGELFGWFEMGSTIVIFSEPGSLEYELEIGRKVRFGEKIGTLKEA